MDAYEHHLDEVATLLTEIYTLSDEAAIDIVFSPLLMFVLSRLSVGFCGQANEPEAFLQAHFDLLTHGLCRSERQR